MFPNRLGKIINLASIKKFEKLIGLNTGKNLNFELWNSYWNTSGLANKMREFIFKFSNNLLGLNTRIAHFNQHVNEACTFCILRKSFPAQRETFVHLFFDCSETNKTLTSFERTYLGNLRLDNEEKRKFFWFFGAFYNVDWKQNLFLALTTKTVLFYIWELWRTTASGIISCSVSYFKTP
jgi:hypothetical protein